VPLKATDLSALTTGVETALPPRLFDSTPFAGGATTAVSGYMEELVKSRLLSLDSFGLPDYVSILHLTGGNVAPGDELSSYYVVWAILPPTTYPRYGLRRLFPFQTFTAVTRVVTSVDIDTEQTQYGTVTAQVQLFLLDAVPKLTPSEHLLEDTTRVKIVDRDSVLVFDSQVTVGTRRYKIDIVQPYGPYQLAFGEAA